jgi:hypothetical protein
MTYRWENIPLKFQSLWFNNNKDIGHMVLHLMDAELFCNVPQRQESQLQKYKTGRIMCEYGSNHFKNLIIATFVIFCNELGVSYFAVYFL